MKTPKLILTFLASAIWAVSLHGQGTIVATDEILAVGDYTRTGSQMAAFRENGQFELEPQAGTHWLRYSAGTGSRDFQVRLTNGFTSGQRVVPGEYTASVDVGRGVLDPSRNGFTTFEFRLLTTDGEEIGERTVIEEYFEPDEGQWTTVTVSYSVPEDSPAIGGILTWGADITIVPVSPDTQKLGTIDNIVVELDADEDYLNVFDTFNAPFDLEFASGETTDSALLRNRPGDFTTQAAALRYEPNSEVLRSSVGFALADNHLPHQDFTLEAEVTLVELTDFAENGVGLAVLGGPHSPPGEVFNASTDTGFYGLVWYPSQSGGNSTLMIREGFNGSILAQAPWEGRTPIGIEEALVDEGFENPSEVSSTWTVGGSPSDFWQFGAPVYTEGTHEGPQEAFEGNNVAGTGLDQNYPANTNAWLRTPAIDLSDFRIAFLSYAEFTNLDDDDTDDVLWHSLTVTVRDASNPNNVLHEVDHYNDVSDGWRERQFELPASVLGNTVVIEFRLESDTVSADQFPGWFIDNVLVTGIPAAEAGTFVLEAEGTFDLGGALDLTFTMTDEDGFSESISAFDADPFTGNLFGVGGRSSLQQESAYDFHHLALTIGDEPDPIVPSIEAPFSYAFGTDEGLHNGADFLQDPQEDWSAIENALRSQTDSADFRNSVAVARVLNFEPEGQFLLSADVTLTSLDTADGESRVGLLLFGAESSDDFDPQDNSSYYTFQWRPSGSGGGSVSIREGFNGAVVAEKDFAEIDSPPVAEVGATYNFRLFGSFSGGTLTFTGVVSDGIGGAANLSGSMPAPAADQNRFGLGARHRAAENAVWDFQTLSWMEEAPLLLPLMYEFGSAAGRDSDDDFVKTGYIPASWNLDTHSLDFRRNFGSTVPSLADASSAANTLDSTPGMNFAMRAQITPSGQKSLPLEFLGDGTSEGSGYVETGITAGNLGIDGGNPRTIEAWAMARTFDNNGTVWAMGNTGTARQDWTLKVAGNTNEWVLNHWGSGGNDIWFDVPDSTNRWVHLAMVFTGTHSVVYVDGEEVAREERADLNTGNDNTFKIGWWHNRPNGPNLDGFVEDVRVWDIVRTEEEIRENRFRRLTGDEDGLVAYWPMDEGEGDMINDLGPNDFHGTFVSFDHSAPQWSETGGSRIGLTFLGESANAANAYRFYWHPFTDELSIYGPGEAGVLDTFDFSGAADAPQYVEGASYTLELTGTYNPASSLNLTGTLSDDNGGEVEIATQLDVSGQLPAGGYFGFSARHPDVSWNGFQMGTPEQIGEPPDDPEGMTFAEWVEDQFGPETDPDIVGPEATPAGDGVANFLKYALGFPAMTRVSAADLPQPEVVDGLLQLTYRERRDGDVTYSPEMSLSLSGADWDGQDVVVVNRTTLNAEFDEVTVRAVPPNGTPRAFLRVTVRQN